MEEQESSFALPEHAISVKDALTRPPSLTNGEKTPTLAAAGVLQSRLDAVPSLAHFEVALVLNAEARAAESRLACRRPGEPRIASPQSLGKSW